MYPLTLFLIIAAREKGQILPILDHLRPPQQTALAPTTLPDEQPDERRRGPLTWCNVRPPGQLQLQPLRNVQEHRTN